MKVCQRRGRDEAPISKHQAPEKLQIPSFNAQAAVGDAARAGPALASLPRLRAAFWNLELGVSLELGAWCLELHRDSNYSLTQAAFLLMLNATQMKPSILHSVKLMSDLPPCHCGVVLTALTLAAFSLPSFATEKDSEIAPPIRTNETNSEEMLRSYLQLQEQLH